MNTYRVTVMVTLDVQAENDSECCGVAVEEVQNAIEDYGQIGRSMWVTGISRDNDGEFMVYEQSKL
jgi:hypothetical protein